MQLFFRPIEKKFEGEGILPHGNFNNTEEWKPLIHYLEKGAIDFPHHIMFKMGDSDGVIQESYTYQNTNSNSNKIANYLINNFQIDSSIVNAAYLSAYGWKREAVPVTQTKNSLITRIFKSIFE